MRMFFIFNNVLNGDPTETHSYIFRSIGKKRVDFFLWVHSMRKNLNILTMVYYLNILFTFWASNNELTSKTSSGVYFSREVF